MPGHSKTQSLAPGKNYVSKSVVSMLRGIPQNTGDRWLSGSRAGRTYNNLRWNGRDFICDKIRQAAVETLQVVQTHERRSSGYAIPVAVCTDETL